MADEADNSEAETRSLIVAIIDFLRDQLTTRTDLGLEDRDCLEIAIQSLEMAYDLEGDGYIQYRFARPLIDIFNQVTNPVSVKDKVQADAHKNEGNNFMRRRMFAEADAAYTKAIELDKWNSIYYCNRAQSRIELKNYFDAIADCRQALMLNPDYAKAHARMGQAYALIHRPREATRCFRQALELEPENERYRQNLRTAENESVPDPTQAIANLISLLLGIGPQTVQDRSSRSLPTSFMIITESHPPTQISSPQNAQICPNTESSKNSQNTTVTGNDTQTNETPTTNSNNISNIAFPRPYGVIDEGAEERPIIEFELPSENENRENFQNPAEFTMDIPLATLSFEFTPRSQPTSSEAQNDAQSTGVTNEKLAEKLQDKDPDDITLLQHESDAIGPRKAQIAPNDFKDKMKSSKSIVQECDESSSLVEKNDNHPEKSTNQACVAEVKENATDGEQKEIKEIETAISTEKDSSNIAFHGQQNGANKNQNQETQNNDAASSAEKSRNNSKQNFNVTLYNFTSDDDNKDDEKVTNPVQNNKNTETAQNGVSKEGEQSEMKDTEDLD